MVFYVRIKKIIVRYNGTNESIAVFTLTRIMRLNVKYNTIALVIRDKNETNASRGVVTSHMKQIVKLFS